MTKIKPEMPLFLLAFAILLAAMLPGARAQENSTDLQGSPRSALDDQRVVAIGDSQVHGAPGIALGHHLIASGATYYTRFGRGNWGVYRWYHNLDSIDQIMERHHPTLVVLILGGNDWYRVEDANYPTYVSRFWEHLKSSVERNKPEGTRSSICWIEPPAAVGQDNAERQAARAQVSEIILETINQTYFVESQDITRSTQGRSADGVHFTHQGAVNWMRQTIPRLEDCVARQHPTIAD